MIQSCLRTSRYSQKDIPGAWLIACGKLTPTLTGKSDVNTTLSAAMNI